MTTKYEAEKKQLQIEKMEQQKELDNKTIEAQQAENRKQQIIIFSTIGGFIIVLGFSIIILRMFRQSILASTQKNWNKEISLIESLCPEFQDSISDILGGFDFKSEYSRIDEHSCISRRARAHSMECILL